MSLKLPMTRPMPGSTDIALSGWPEPPPWAVDTHASRELIFRSDPAFRAGHRPIG